MAIWDKIYSRINWRNFPNKDTAINDQNLNKMDYALDQLDTRVVELSGYQDRAETSATKAETSEKNAKDSEDNAKDYALYAQSYAVGTDDDYREGDSTDNAKFYSEESKRYKEEASKFTPEGYEQAINRIEGLEEETTDLDERVVELEQNAKNVDNAIGALTDETNALNEALTNQGEEIEEINSNLTKSLLGKRAWLKQQTFNNVNVTTAWGNIFESNKALEFDYSDLELSSPPSFVSFSLAVSTGCWIEIATRRSDLVRFFICRGAMAQNVSITATALIIE